MGKALWDILSNILGDTVADWLRNNKSFGWATMTGLFFGLWSWFVSLPLPAAGLIILSSSVLIWTFIEYLRRRNYSRRNQSSIEQTKPIPKAVTKEPEIIFDCPLQGADMDQHWFLSWWHIPVSLETIPNSSITSYEHCTAKLRVERIYSDGEYLVEKPKTHDMRCRSRDGAVVEFALRMGDESKQIPITRRTEEVPQDRQKEFNSWDQQITDDQFFLGQVNGLLPGRYELTLEIRNSDYNKTWSSPSYILTVPQGGDGGKSNGHFILSKKADS